MTSTYTIEVEGCNTLSSLKLLIWIPWIQKKLPKGLLYSQGSRLKIYFGFSFEKKGYIHTYYHSSSYFKEITTVSKDMSVSSLGAKINSEENSPPLPEFSNCYFEKLWWYLALSRWPQNTNTEPQKLEENLILIIYLEALLILNPVILEKWSGYMCSFQSVLFWSKYPNLYLISSK